MNESEVFDNWNGWKCLDRDEPLPEYQKEQDGKMARVFRSRNHGWVFTAFDENREELINGRSNSLERAMQLCNLAMAS